MNRVWKIAILLVLLVVVAMIALSQLGAPLDQAAFAPAPQTAQMLGNAIPASQDAAQASPTDAALQGSANRPGNQARPNQGHSGSDD